MAKEEEDQPNEEKAPAESGGGIKVWIPLIATLIVMPATAFLLSDSISENITKEIQKGLGIKSTETEDGVGTEAENKDTGDTKDGEEKPTNDVVVLEKTVANVKGASNRFLVGEITLKGYPGKGIEKKVKQHTAELEELADTVLGSYTLREVSDLASVRNRAKHQLMSDFSNVLGQDVIKAVFLTELNVQ